MKLKVLPASKAGDEMAMTRLGLIVAVAGHGVARVYRRQSIDERKHELAPGSAVLQIALLVAATA